MGRKYCFYCLNMLRLINLLLTLTPILAVPPKTLNDRRIIVLGEKCPEITGSANFDPETYLGTWFNMANSPFIWQPDVNPCITAQYYPPSENSDYDIQVVNSEFSVRQGRRFTTVGKATIDTNTTGTLNVAFGPTQPLQGADNYIILDTDNVNFAWIWSCQNYCDSEGNCDGDQPILWILNRDHNGSESFVQKQIDAALEIVMESGYSENAAEQIRQRMHVTDQSSETCDRYYEENQDLKP